MIDNEKMFQRIRFQLKTVLMHSNVSTFSLLVCYLPRQCVLVCLHTHTYAHTFSRQDEGSVSMKAIAK